MKKISTSPAKIDDGDVICPHCGSRQDASIGAYEIGVYECLSCPSHFSITENLKDDNAGRRVDQVLEEVKEKFDNEIYGLRRRIEKLEEQLGL